MAVVTELESLSGDKAAVRTLLGASVQVDEVVALLFKTLNSLLDSLTKMGTGVSVEDVTLGLLGLVVATTAAAVLVIGGAAGRARAAGGGGAGVRGDDVLPAAGGGGLGGLGGAAAAARAGAGVVLALLAGALVAVTTEVLEALAVVIDAAAPVDEDVAVFLEGLGLAGADLTTGNVYHEGMLTNDVLDTDGRELDGTEQLHLVQLLDRAQVIGLDNDVMTSLGHLINKLSIAEGLVVEGVDQVGTVDSNVENNLLLSAVVNNTTELAGEGLIDDQGNVAALATLADDLSLGLGLGGALVASLVGLGSRGKSVLAGSTGG